MRTAPRQTRDALPPTRRVSFRERLYPLTTDRKLPGGGAEGAGHGPTQAPPPWPRPPRSRNFRPSRKQLFWPEGPLPGVCFTISRSNALVDSLSAASSTPGVPGPSTATVPARGEPRLVGGSSAAGAGPESVPVKSLRGWSSPDLSAPVLFTVSAPHPAPCQVPLGVYSPAFESGVGPSRLLPTLRPAAPCPLLNLRPHPGSILGPSPAALQAFPSQSPLQRGP